MAPGQIQPQDPSMSPTYSLSSNHVQPSIPTSIRRNLFAGHLSKRPNASTSHGPLSPSSLGREEIQAQSGIFPTSSLPQPGSRSIGYQDIYDTSQISSTAQAALARDNSIVAVNPATGRPILPHIPVLPARLHLGEENMEDEDEDEDEDMEGGPDSFAHPGYVRSPAIHNHLNLQTDFDLDLDHEMDSSELERLGAYSQAELGLNNFLDLNSEDSRRERERIEHLLAEMQARQRARARTVIDPPVSSLSMAADLSFPSAPRATSRSTLKSSHQPTTTRTRSRRGESPTKVDHSRAQALLTAPGGIGPSIDPAEKDELMGLIMTSLRRKLHTAEEEGWMYGGADGLGGIGVGVGGDDMGGYD